jgi:hypothetical protein
MSFYNNLVQEDSNAAVTLMVNSESTRLLRSEYEGKTASQLFAEYGGRLGLNDASRVTAYQFVGDVTVERPGNTQVRAGETIRGVVTNEKLG